MTFVQIIDKIKNLFKENRSKDRFFKRRNLIPGCQRIEVSTLGKFKLTIEKYSTKKGYTNQSRGIVKNIAGDVVADVKRNYSSFPFCWAEDHSNGHDYLVCGEDYQGQTIIELDTGKRVDYLPVEAKKGWGFCWGEINASPDKLMLAVHGCYWGCPYEVMFIDFSDPMKELPYLKNQIKCEYISQEFHGWNGDNTANISYEKIRRKSDNKWEDELTDDEQDKMYEEDDYEEIPVKTIWTK